MPKRLAVIVSQAQSKNPQKRQLEEDIVAALIMEPGIDVTVVPNLYDLKPEGTGILALQGVSGNMVVLSWLFPRAARWILDRNDIRGQEGQSLLEADDADEDEEEAQDALEAADDKPRVIDHRPLPARKIYCIDLRVESAAAPYVEEIKRIAAEANTQVVELGGWLGGSPAGAAAERFNKPTNDTFVGAPAQNGNGAAGNGAAAGDNALTGGENGKAAEGGAAPITAGPDGAAVIEPIRIEEQPGRRWYPVIDYSRCTNCMECIDFCLFGVYGVDNVETILVEQPDNCRKGCPACSRVCPENAIIFPQHKTPAIAGSSDVAASLKIDLSKLFGAPSGEDAAEVAIKERDEQLLLAGREAVGATVGVPKRQENRAAEPKDDLDDLIDQLDDLDV